MRLIKYTKLPVYTKLSDIELFEGVSVQCLKFSRNYELDIGERRVTRRYKSGSYLITRGDVTYVHGDYSTESLTKRINVKMVSVFDRDVIKIRPLLQVANKMRGKIIHVRQRGFNRGYAYFMNKERVKC